MRKNNRVYLIFKFQINYLFFTMEHRIQVSVRIRPTLEISEWTGIENTKILCTRTNETFSFGIF